MPNDLTQELSMKSTAAKFVQLLTNEQKSNYVIMLQGL
jgi:hypothetical protein